METVRAKSRECREESLTSTVGRHALEVALAVGRRLFETGHFAYAPLSAAKALPPEDARAVVSLEEAKRLLPWPLLDEAESLEATRVVSEALRQATGAFRTHLVHLARSELNHLQSHPNTSSLAASCLAYLDALPPADTLAATSAELSVRWKGALAKKLSLPHAGPIDLHGLLSAEEHDALRSHLLALVAATEGLVRALCHFGEKRLLHSAPPPPRAAREALREFESLAKSRERFLAHTVDLQGRGLARAHHGLLEGNPVAACLALEAAVRDARSYFAALCETERASGLHVARERNLPLENFHYVKALARQLVMAGVDPADARAAEDALFRYAGEHACPCAELLDDEILAQAGRLPREALAIARLRVRHEDPAYPLSVAARNAVLARAREGAPPSQLEP